MMRVHGWDVALAQYCDAMRRQDLGYGFSDCIMFGAGGVEVQLGVDYAAPHRGKYSTRDEAYAYMASKGWNDVDDVVDSFLQRAEFSLRRRGDLLGFDDGPAGKSIGICLGRYAMVMSPLGAVHYPAAKAFVAWRVGDDA